MDGSKIERKERQRALLKRRKSSLLVAISPVLEAEEFKRTRLYHDGGRVAPREVLFQRLKGQTIEEITVSFDKYDRSLFQIRLLKCNTSPPYEFICNGSLVRSRSQYYYFWGVRWWSVRRQSAWDHAVKKVFQGIPQILAFFEGERGRNISRQVQQTH